MKPSDIFGIIVRTAGFVIVIYSLYDILTGFDNLFENILQSAQGGEGSSNSTFSYFVFGVPEFVFGALCFFLADWIVKLAYRDSSS
jgi:hypothetical protein